MHWGRWTAKPFSTPVSNFYKKIFYGRIQYISGGTDAAGYNKLGQNNFCIVGAWFIFYNIFYSIIILFQLHFQSILGRIAYNAMRTL
jgi:hypothetical protein